MNVLLTGSNGYIGKSIFKSKIKNVNIFEGNRQTIDLYNRDNIISFIEINKIDCVIHCAVEGGSRLKKDTADNFYNNLLMFENLYNCRHLYNKFINFASGAEFDRRYNIENKKESEIYKCFPIDYYGLYKNIVARKCFETKNFYNLRVFGCFDENELSSRFIKTCIINTLNQSEIILNKKKIMDFFYMGDLIKIIEYILKNDDTLKDYNLCYKEKYNLEQIANTIFKFLNKTTLLKDNTETYYNYFGSADQISKINIVFNGLEKGVERTIININENRLRNLFR